MPKKSKTLVRYVLFFLFYVWCRLAPAVSMSDKLKMLHKMVADVKKRTFDKQYALEELTDFVAYEKKSLQTALTLQGSEAYYKTLSKHLETGVALLQEYHDFLQAPKWRLKTLKSGYLENWNAFYTG